MGVSYDNVQIWRAVEDGAEDRCHVASSWILKLSECASQHAKPVTPSVEHVPYIHFWLWLNRFPFLFLLFFFPNSISSVLSSSSRRSGSKLNARKSTTN